MPSSELGAEVLRNWALNCWPWVRSLTQPPARSDPLARRNGGCVADQGDQIAMAAGFDANDAKPVVSVLVGDALDQPGEHLPIR